MIQRGICQSKSTTHNFETIVSDSVLTFAYVQNVRFLKILQCPDFEIFLVIPDTFPIPKSLMKVMGDFFFAKNTLSSHVHALQLKSLKLQGYKKIILNHMERIYLFCRYESLA